MMILIIGTPDSGKSVLAESIITEHAGEAEKIYIATMIPFDEQGRRRIEKHRRMRAGKGFITVEQPYGLSTIVQELKGKYCLLECISNLTGNEMHLDSNRELDDGQLVGLIVGSVADAAKSAKELVVVTNVFDTDGPGYDAETHRYTELIKRVNAGLAGLADVIMEQKDGVWGQV